MKVNALRTMLVCSFMFKNPFRQESPCSSGNKILGRGQKNQGIHWEGLKFEERKVCGIQTCRMVPTVRWTRRHTQKYKQLTRVSYIIKIQHEHVKLKNKEALKRYDSYSHNLVSIIASNNKA